MTTVERPASESRVGRGTHGVHVRNIFTPQLLDQCIACGFCLPVCPTYQMTGVEQFSPRGRISLMRALQAGELDPDDPTLFAQSSACLGCRACEVVCPAGVRYGHLLEEWRDHQWRGRHRPVLAWSLMQLVRWSWPLRLLGLVRRAAPVEKVALPAPAAPPGPAAPAGIAGPAVRANGATPVALSPVPPEPAQAANGPSAHASAVAASGAHSSGAAVPSVGASSSTMDDGRAVADDGSAGPSLMLGCVERGLFPGVSRSARALCPELRVPSGQGCCGALHSHNGEKEAGERMAAELGRQLPGTIVTTAGGCAAHLAEVLGRDRVRELSQYLTDTGRLDLTCSGSGPAGAGGPDPAGDAGAARQQAAPAGGKMPVPAGEVRVDGRRARVTLQDSCHLRNVLGVAAEPRKVLASVAEYVELPESTTCCGAAGSYSVLEPRRSRAILARKVEAIERLGIDIVVTLNPGCQRQLAQGLRRAKSRVRAVHLADLLVEAGLSASGPEPGARPVRQPRV